MDIGKKAKEQILLGNVDALKVKSINIAFDDIKGGTIYGLTIHYLDEDGDSLMCANLKTPVGGGEAITIMDAIDLEIKLVDGISGRNYSSSKNSESEKLRCSYCNHLAKKGSLYCKSCGAELG